MTADVETGSVIDGRFELEEPLGSGGLATVWRATDRETGWPAAVKCENVGEHDREQVRAHFRQELRWFRRFEDGPVPGSLVHFLDGAVREGTVYVATELIEGASLETAVETDVTPGIEAVRTVGGPVCRALAYLHRNGVVHLDSKPNNVLCRRRGPPAVIDLNAAVSTGEETGTLFHADPFKPPELTPTDARDERTGPWSDVYALGVLIAYLLTGETVGFESASIAEWRPVDPRVDGHDCPPELAAVIRQATEPRPQGRFVDADALYAALTSVLETGDRSARLHHGQSGLTVRVDDGTTIGRWTPDSRVPDVVVPDDDRFVSPDHAVFALEDGAWVLRDRSLNGTVVRTGAETAYVLSSEGRTRQQEERGGLSRPDPEPSIRLSDGDRITPVHPDYAPTLEFRTG